jgi:hypothetical protein
MAFKIDTRRKDLVEEFRRNPIGHHSAELQLILNLFRGAPVAEKYVLVATEPHKMWALAQLPARRGEAPRMLNRAFRSQEEAEWEVFKLRWERYTGETLED